ncbi:MAG: FAD-binding oxidoreductase [Alphaproteobacteria bacterium]|nr:FAD-binding oxidoreductase [Alphaproteobacteria bacterium]
MSTIERLKTAAGSGGFSEDIGEIAPHLTEWRGKYSGCSPLLLKPATTREVSALLAICHETGTPVVPQGGNTGLVGGQIPFHGEVLLSTKRLNKIRAVDSHTPALVAEAGVTLAGVQQAAMGAGLFFPLSLASEGSCTIGGNVSTNAGGTHVIRYGMTRALVMGLEVVLADGRVLDLLRLLPKDNTGYDLKQAFIGAEGTLGIVTAAALKLFPQPKSRAVGFAAVASPAAALELLREMQVRTGGLVSAFELLPRVALDLVIAHIPGTCDPLSSPSPWYVLVEATAGEGVDLQALFENGLLGANDAVIAASEAQAAALWALRENISEAQKREGASIKHDIAVPVARVPDFLAAAVSAVLKLAPGARPVSFGHLGDGNLHFNLQSPRRGDDKRFLALWEGMQLLVHDLVRDFGGSISAEHGIGVMKRDALPRYKSHEELEVMRALKAALDPKNILNPGKLVPPVLKL